MPEPVWNDHSLLPVFESKAMNWPLWEPVKTTPPAVESTPDQNGDLFSTRHTALPATGSHATSAPRLPSSGLTKPPSSRPRYQFGPPGRSCLTYLTFMPKSIEFRNTTLRP